MALRGTSVRDALDSARVPLAAAGVPTPRLDAEVLLAHALRVDRAALYADPGLEVAGEAAAEFRELVRRRREREPVAYLVGRRGFRHIELEVDPRVFIPRADTETLVEAALELPQGTRVLEVGTGSGAVALALKHERPDLEVVAGDRSLDALEVARANARRLGLDVTFHHAEGVEAVPGGPYEAVVSNPPYVPEEDRPTLPPELLHHEPPGAFWAGPGGLDSYRILTSELGAARWVAFEVGDGQADAVRGLLAEAGFGETGTRRDLSQTERVVVGRRSG